MLRRAFRHNIKKSRRPPKPAKGAALGNEASSQ
jgi:hypothetical protein